jgi:dipeptidyl aminopeptidase/acylaminoacyl peptidase
LPGGRRFLFFVGTGPPETEGVYLGSLDGVDAKRLVTAATAAAYAPPGYLLVGRQGVLLARQMDLTSGKVGEAIPIAEPIASDLFGRSAGFSVSMTGVLAYRAPSDRRQLVWMDRTGRLLTTFGPPEGGNLLDPALAPDGQQVVVSRTTRNNFDVWIHEISRPIAKRFTVDSAIDAAAVWSPDGSRLAFVSNRSGLLDLYENPVKGTAGPEESLLASANNKISMDWSRDGRFLLYQATDAKTGWDLWALPLTGERKPFPVVQTASTERCGQFSPDGQWVAYDSNESGHFEVFVQSFPRPGEKWQISTGGGAWPRWRRDGRELYYVAPDGTLMAVPMRVPSGGQPLQLGEPVRLFRTSIVGGGAPRDSLKQQYDVSADGQRFLVNITTDSLSPITVVQNWMTVLNR